ncbi:MAG: T9SS type A sorting domain-containing protein [Paludibacter sp.]
MGAGGATPTSTGLTSAKGATGGDLTVTMNNCIVRNLTSAGRVFAFASSGTGWATQTHWYGDLTVTNSEFSGTYAGVISFGSQYAGPNNTTFRNCYFSGLTGTIISNGLAASNTTNSLTLDHCTFNGSTGIEIIIKNGGTSTTIVKNSLFANSPGSSTSTDVIALSTNPGNAANTNNAVYYSSAANLVQLISTRYPSGLLGAYITSNPSLSNNFATATAYIGTATDNRNIGYYNFAVLTPYITASTTTITGMGYNLGAGPSAEKSFTVSAFDLTNGLVITPTSNLEISTTSGSNFSTNAISLTPTNHDVAPTTIYVRLKAGLAINTYNQSIAITHTGATTRNISIAAQVISSTPNIQTSVASLTGFTRYQAGGPSQPKTFVVTGANLTDDINITPPTNFEISLSPTTGYTYSILTLSKYGNALNTTVYVRLSKNLLTGSSTQNLTLSSAGATSVNVSCSGSITAIATTNFNTNAANNIDLRIASNYSAAAMPIFSSQDHVNKVFVRNPACWASDLDLTCISPSNYSYNNLHAGTLITARHAILAAHFKLSTGDSLYFVTADNVTVRRKIIGYKTNTIFSPTQFPDLEIVTLDSDVPSSIKPCVFLPSNYATYLSNDGRNLPTFSTDQEEKALVNEVEALNSLLVINSNPAVKMYSEHACTGTPRSSLHEAIISGDSGNPVFLIIRGELVLVSARTWDNGAGTSYTHFANLAAGGTTSATDPTLNTLSINDLIAQTDAVAGVSTGYQVKYFDFVNAPATTAQYTVSAPINSSTLTASSDVTVTSSGTLTVNTSTTLNNVIVAPGAKLNLSNPLVVNDLTLKSDINTSFSTNFGSTGITVNGEINFLKKMDDTKWYFMSFPCDVPVSKIKQSDGSSLGVLGTDWFIKYYDGAQYATNGNATVNWLNFTDPTLLANKGYIFGLLAVGVKELSFPLTKAVAGVETLQTIPVTAYGAGTSAPTGRTGWNLIGQPYLSKFAGTNAGVNYMTYSDGTSTYSQLAKADVTIDPMSAYFVQVDANIASSGVSFALAGRQAAPSLVANEVSESVKLNFTNSTGVDNTNIVIDNAQSTAYQIGQDLEKWLVTGTSKPQVYTLIDDVKYAFNALPMTDVVNLPLGIYTSTAGATTIAADATQAPSLSKLMLIDTKFSPAVITDLLTSNYSFTADAGTDNTRFKITAQQLATTILKENITQSPICKVYNSNLIISDLAQNSIVRLYDISGRELMTRNENKNNLEIALPIKGIYTIQVQNLAEIWTQKIVNW